MCLGIPARIVAISDAAQQRAAVDLEGVTHEVSVAMLALDGPGGAHVGDWVVVHVGFAMAKIDEVEAREILDFRIGLAALYEQMSSGDPHDAGATLANGT